MVEGTAPSYPNWQRKRIQNPYSVSSNLTEGTHAAKIFPLVTERWPWQTGRWTPTLDWPLNATAWHWNEH